MHVAHVLVFVLGFSLCFSYTILAWLVFYIILFYHFGNMFRREHSLLRVKCFISSYNSSFNFFVSAHSHTVTVRSSKFPNQMCVLSRHAFYIHTKYFQLI